MAVLLASLLAVVLGTVTPTATPKLEAVVRIHSDLGGGLIGIGTGFFITGDGQVLTCYHVIRGARRITIFYDRKQWTDVAIEGIAPDLDLARLRVRGIGATTPFVPLATDRLVGKSTEEVSSVGFPRGISKQTVVGRLTSDGAINSTTLVNEKGQAIFHESMDVIPIDLTVYSGMSGAPVVSARGLVGVLSGSLAEGSGIAWAIPRDYASRLQPIGKDPNTIGEWPSLKVMGRTWKSMRALIRQRDAPHKSAYEYLLAIQDLDESLRSAATSAVSAQEQIRIVRQIIGAGLANGSDLEATQLSLRNLPSEYDVFNVRLSEFSNAWAIVREQLSATAQRSTSLLTAISTPPPGAARPRRVEELQPALVRVDKRLTSAQAQVLGVVEDTGAAMSLLKSAIGNAQEMQKADSTGEIARLLRKYLSELDAGLTKFDAALGRIDTVRADLGGAYAEIGAAYQDSIYE